MFSSRGGDLPCPYSLSDLYFDKNLPDTVDGGSFPPGGQSSRLWESFDFLFLLRSGTASESSESPFPEASDSVRLPVYPGSFLT